MRFSLPWPFPALFFGRSVKKRTFLCVTAVCGLLAAALFTPSGATAMGTRKNLPHPGFRSVGVWNAETHMRMTIGVWYPSRRLPRDISLEGWAVRASKDSAPIPGLYPVILLSHDASGSRLASHDLAAHLARNGFIVIAPTHPGDNVDDTNRFFRAGLFIERPNHLIQALDAVAATPAFAPLLDRSRIGFLGVGSGAVTVLQLAGATPDLSRLETYCPTPTPLDPLCSPWAVTLHPRMRREFTLLQAKYGGGAFTPSIPLPAPKKDAAGKETPESTRPQQEATATPPQPAEGETAQQGIHAQNEKNAPPAAAQGDAAPEKQPLLAIGLLTPGQIGLFPDASLRAVTVPVGVVAAADDSVYPPSAIERLQELLPGRPATRIVQGANHFDMHAPCPPVYHDTFPALCGHTTSSATDARKIRNEFFVRFFQRLLGEPIPPPDTATAAPQATGKR